MLDRLKTYGQVVLRVVALAAVGGGVVAVGLLGWHWQTTVTVERVTVAGTDHAPADSVRALARVDSGMTMDAVDAPLIADRVRRHPWVAGADVTKQRSQRTLLIEVHEHNPAALVVDAEGRLAYYLDREGYALPRSGPDKDETTLLGGYDVPLVRGLDAAYHPVRRIAPTPLQEVLSALPSTETDGLVSEIALTEEGVRLLTTPIKPHGILTVRLGTGNVPAKLSRLRAFAEQVLAGASDDDRRGYESSVAEIDLRFDDQIVARDHPLDS